MKQTKGAVTGGHGLCGRLAGVKIQRDAFRALDATNLDPDLAGRRGHGARERRSGNAKEQGT